MNTFEVYHLRFLITAKCIRLLHKDNAELKTDVLSDLKSLAKYYHCQLKKTAKIEHINAIIMFCQFEKGADKCINQIYSNFYL